VFYEKKKGEAEVGLTLGGNAPVAVRADLMEEKRNGDESTSDQIHRIKIETGERTARKSRKNVQEGGRGWFGFVSG